MARIFGEGLMSDSKNNILPTELKLKSIGHFSSEQVEPYQASRQPDNLSSRGFIHLHQGFNYEQALTDLNGCSHIWIIFGFHHNQNWKPLVQTPRSDRKIGVFATRAPYRPNPIGLSLVELIKVDQLTIEVGPNDLLDGSPIYDIKPYHPESDQAVYASIEWLENSLHQKNNISISPSAEDQISFLEQNGQTQLRSFIYRQLEYDPINKKKKRVEEKTGYYTLSYRTWRIDFSYSENSIGILSISSGYTEEELKITSDTIISPDLDPYQDKSLHRRFKKEFT